MRISIARINYWQKIIIGNKEGGITQRDKKK